MGHRRNCDNVCICDSNPLSSLHLQPSALTSPPPSSCVWWSSSHLRPPLCCTQSTRHVALTLDRAAAAIMWFASCPSRKLSFHAIGPFDTVLPSAKSLNFHVACFLLYPPRCFEPSPSTCPSPSCATLWPTARLTSAPSCTSRRCGAQGAATSAASQRCPPLVLAGPCKKP